MVASGQGAYGARSYFEPQAFKGPAIWCFDRFGKSFTELPDGRVVEIAGEHEDFYDQDFCIYNDVIVHGGDGTFNIYGYPKEVFPPTDFHTATLVGSAIYVIGNVGYQGERRLGATQVYRLELDSWAFDRVETTGEGPGWIGKHKAKLVGSQIEVSGGKVFSFDNEQALYEDNPDRFVLDLESMIWSMKL
jgi:hypothetical protein